MIKWHGAIAGQERDGFTYGSAVFLYDPQTQQPRFLGWFCGFNDRDHCYYVELKNTVGTLVGYNRLSILTSTEAQMAKANNYKAMAAA